MTTVLWIPSPLVLDGNCISYWLDTLDFTTEPEAMDGLRDQKLALVRMFFYWPSGTLSVVARGRDEVESITDPKRLQKHQQWMDVHLTELPRLGGDVVAPIVQALREEGVNSKDSKWLAEALAHKAPIAVTWDQGLLAQAGGRKDISVISPYDAWNAYSVPPGTAPRIRPAASNPLRIETWWRV